MEQNVVDSMMKCLNSGTSPEKTVKWLSNHSRRKTNCQKAGEITFFITAMWPSTTTKLHRQSQIGSKNWLFILINIIKSQ